MGNAPSTEVPLRPSQRLSKIRVPGLGPQFRKTDDGEYSRSQTAAPTSSRVAHGASDYQPSPGYAVHEYGPSQEAFHAHRTYPLDKPEQSLRGRIERQNTDTSEPRRGSILASYPAPNVAGVGRRESSLGPHQSTSSSPTRERFVWNQSPSRYTTETAQQDTASVSNERPGYFRRLTSNDSTRSALPVRPSGESGQSPDSLYVPLRRRSTNRIPGVATRVPREPTPTLSTASHNTSDAEQPTHAITPRSNTPAKHDAKQPWAPRPQLAYDYERAGTPTERDYVQLGAIKQGSLRVMNGSPVPSYRSNQEKREHRHHLRPALIEDEGIQSTNTRDFTEPPVNGNQQFELANVSAEGHSLQVAEHARPLDGSQSSITPTNQPEKALRAGDRSDFGYSKHLQPGLDPRVEAIKSDGPSRSDSDRGSTTSSDSSRQTQANKADSGYGSNISLTSLNFSRGRRSFAATSKPSEPGDLVATEVEKRKKKRSSWLYGRSSPSYDATTAISQHRKHASSSAIRNSSLSSKSEVFLPSALHDNLDSVPAIPVTVQRSLRHHEQGFPVTSKHMSFRNKPSKETLKTIPSIDSTPGSQQYVDAELEWPPHNNTTQFPALPSFVKDSLPQSWRADPGKPIIRKPVGSKSRHSLQPTSSSNFYEMNGRDPPPRVIRQSFHGAPSASGTSEAW